MAIGTFPGMLQEGDHASRPAASAVGSGALYACSDHSLIYQSDGSSWATWWTGAGGSGGGGGGGVAVRHSPSQAPASPEDENDEFDDAAIDAKWTRIAHGTPRGTWTERHDSIAFQHTVAGTNEIDGWSQPHAASVGDVLEAAFEWETSVLCGMALGFSSSATYGSGSQVSCDIHNNSDLYRYMLNTYSGYASRSADGTIANRYRMGQVVHVRVKYEAANTFGLYASRDGIYWETIQNNYSLTLTPTHIFFGAAMVGTTVPAASVVVRVHDFRLNP